MGRTERVVKSSYDSGVKFHDGLIVLIIGLLFALYFWLGGYHLSVVCSGSMNPLLLVDDLVIIRESEDIKVGDVVVYEKDGDEIIHRVIKADGDTLTTKGDANTVEDDPIEISAVKGKLVTIFPYIGGAIRTVRAPIDAVLAKMRAGDEISDSASVAAWVVDLQENTQASRLTSSAVNPAIYYSFSVSNFRDDIVCEVSSEYQIVVKIPEISGTDHQIKFRLQLTEEDEENKENEALLTAEIESGDRCTFTDTEGRFRFEGGKKDTHTYALKIFDSSGQITNETVIDNVEVSVITYQID
jgi:signal peptidase